MKNSNKKSTVYKLYESGRIVYIGETENLTQREKEHRGDGKKFSKRAAVSSRVSKDKALELEKKLLQKYRTEHGGKNPKYNKNKDG